MENPWMLVVGSWGDIICNYGNVCKKLDELQQEKANIVYFGLYKDIVAFLKSQKRIGQVLHLQISDATEYYAYTALASVDLQLFLRMTGIYDQIPNLIPAHISHFYNVENPTLCNRDFEMQLPSPKMDWTELVPNEPFLVFQPFSCGSVTLSDHWPHWMEALDYTLNDLSVKVILIGQIQSPSDPSYVFPYVEHQNLVNIVGQTPSMIDIFNIMQKAKGLISTSNSLSMWSIITKKPSLVVCNKIIKDKGPYYYNWINYPPNEVLESNISLKNFCITAKNFVRNYFST